MPIRLNAQGKVDTSQYLQRQYGINNTYEVEPLGVCELADALNKALDYLCDMLLIDDWKKSALAGKAAREWLAELEQTIPNAVDESVYLSAVKGRSDFRDAYRCERARRIELVWLLREALERIPDWETGVNKDLRNKISAAIAEVHE